MVAGKQWGLTGFDAHGHGHRCSRTRQVSPPGCQGPAQLRAHFLQEGVSGFPGGTLRFAFSQGPSAFLVPWVSGSALSDSQSALDDRVFFCHLPGRLLRDRGARMNPSGIEEGRRLPMQS